MVISQCLECTVITHKRYRYDIHTQKKKICFLSLISDNFQNWILCYVISMMYMKSPWLLLFSEMECFAAISMRSPHSLCSANYIHTRTVQQNVQIHLPVTSCDMVQRTGCGTMWRFTVDIAEQYKVTMMVVNVFNKAKTTTETCSGIWRWFPARLIIAYRY